MRRPQAWVCALALSLLVTGTARAQTGQRGSISGTVNDSQGAAIAAVVVSAQNTETNVATTAVTNDAGVYLITALVSGKYRVSFVKIGFGVEPREVEVRTGEQIRLDVTAGVAKLVEEVNVVADTPLLNVASATRGTSFQGSLVENLPINGRNPFTLVLSTPGVQYNVTSASISFRPFDNGGMDRFTANGGVNNANQFLLNGMPNTNGGDSNGNNLSFVPPPESVEEVRVDTNVYDAQFGRSGGAVVNVSVRSGTNRYKGTASYLFRNQGLNQNLYQNIVAGVPKTDLFQANPVISFGGPVKLPHYDGTNRTFFFSSYEFLKSGVPNGVSQRAPTDREKAGDFSLSGLTGPLRDPVTGQIFANNIIPANRIDPVSKALLQYMVSPNVTPDAAGNNFIPTPNSRFDTYSSGLGRVDHNMGNSRIAVTYGANARHETRATNGREPIAIAGTDGHHRRWNTNVAGDVTSVLSSTLVSTLRLGWSQHIRQDLNLDQSFDSTTLGFGTNYLGLIPRSNFFQPITLDTYSGAALGTAGNGFYTKDSLFSVGETLTKNWGAHQVKVGGEFGLNPDQQQLAAGGANVAAFNFTAHYTSTTPTATNLGAAAGGNAFASFLLGYPRSGSVTLAQQPYLYWSGNYVAGYLQDDWRVTSHLTLNLGLRYDLETPVSERSDLLVSGFDAAAVNPLSPSASGALPVGINGRCAACPTAAVDPTIANNRADRGAALAGLVGGPTFADATGGIVYRRDRNNIGPRIGLTDQLSDKVVLRAGWGRMFLNGLIDRPQTAQVTRTTNYVSSNDNNATPNSRLSQTPLLSGSGAGPALYPNGLLQPFGTSQGLASFAGTNVTFQDRNKPNAEFDTYSTGIQYQLPARSVVDISYVGSHTRNLALTKPLNQLTPAQIALGDTFLNAQVANPFLGLGTGFNGTTVSRLQLLRTYPQFVNVSEVTFEGRQWYNALQVAWEKRLSHGVSMQANYTYSRAYEEVAPLNQGEANYKQRTGFDRPHVVRLTGSWELPRFESRRAWLRYSAGGWSMGSVVAFRSGILVGMPTNVDVIGDYHLADPNRGRAFNTCTLGVDGVTRNACADANDQRAADPGRAPLQPAFRLRPTNALDTTGDRLDDVRISSPPILDMNFIRTIQFSSRVKAQIRVEIYNLTGAVQFPSAGTNTNNFTTFGTVANNQANDPRFVMLNFRLSY